MMTKQERSDFLADLAGHFATNDPADVNLTVKMIGVSAAIVIHKAPHSVIQWVYGWISSHRYGGTVTAHLSPDGLTVS